MTKTAAQLIDEALQLLGVLPSGQSAGGTQAGESLDILNEMIDAWQAERTMLFTSARASYALTANTQTYTIGTGGAFDQARPLWIAEARVIPDSSLAAAQQQELPCAVLSLAQWARKVLKSQTSAYPSELYYDRGLSASERGIVTFWPIPTNANVRAVLYTPTVLSSFADLATAYAFSPAYPRAIKYNLAMELAIPNGAQPSADLSRLAIMTKATIENVNLVVPVLRCDPGIAASGAWWDPSDTRSGGY